MLIKPTEETSSLPSSSWKGGPQGLGEEQKPFVSGILLGFMVPIMSKESWYSRTSQNLPLEESSWEILPYCPGPPVNARCVPGLNSHLLCLVGLPT